MTASITPAAEPGAAGGGPARPDAARLDRLLAGPSDPDEVRAAIDALTDDELTGFGWAAYRLNLMSLFGAIWPAARVAEVARDAARSKIWLGWEYHHHRLPRLTARPEPPRLDDAPIEAVRSLLALGRGLVVVLFHHGHMRDLPSDLAHAAISIMMPLARDSFENYDTARRHNPDAAVWAHLKFANVEESRGAIALAKHLARGGTAVATIDGNTGIDGARGDDRRATVGILGCRARVKDGMIRMAARFGSPILPIITPTIDGGRTCLTSRVIDPGGPLAGADADRFVQDALQDCYDALGRALQVFPGEWSGGDLFHQWRIADELPGRDLEEATRELTRDLEAGGTATVNAERIVALPGDGIVWTDARTMRCYRLPVDMAGLADRLSKGGVDKAWLDRQEAASRARMWAVLCQLAARCAVRSAARPIG